MMDIEKVKGIGTKIKGSFNKMDIYTVDDLVTHYPYRYDLIKRSNLKDPNDGDKVIIDGKIDSVPILIRLKSNLNKMNFRLVSVDKNIVGVSIFNRAFLKNNLSVGTSVTVFGKYDKFKNIITASDIRIGLLGDSEKIEAVYRGTSGLSSKNIAGFINQALMEYGNEITDNIPKYLIEKYDFLNKKTSLNIVHNPSNKDKLELARNRLKYEELFTFMTKINYLKLKNKKINSGISKSIDMAKINELINSLPYKLTSDQNAVIDEIFSDMTSPRLMNRLLQGDVGSGKTVVSVVAMYANILAGYQSALMVPTEILAMQHYHLMTDMLKIFNVRIELLIGPTPKKDKNRIYKDLETGEIDIVIGTHALFQEQVVYKNLGLIVTDEQHRFGVLQRSCLKEKGTRPDILYMSATPIPRTYALTIYGDMDISTINTLPSGRKPIETFVKKDSEIKDVLYMMLEELENNHQIYVIAPLIEENDNLDLTNVNELKDKMNVAFGKDYNVDLIHGKLKQVEKDQIMEKFKENKTQILISTTVIEVGVDVPNATMIVIFDASRFGLSTLHQLRGRVGRSDIKSKCILISNNDVERLSVMEKTNNGFEISEADFRLRGHGDLFGVKQSGDMFFKIANLKQDYKLLLQAKKDSLEFLNNDSDNELKQKIISQIKEG